MPNGKDSITVGVTVPKWLVWLVALLVSSAVTGSGVLAFATRQDLHSNSSTLRGLQEWRTSHEAYSSEWRQSVTGQLDKIDTKLDNLRDALLAINRSAKTSRSHAPSPAGPEQP